jgi:release factor glutamine methyltransferase
MISNPDYLRFKEKFGDRECAHIIRIILEDYFGKKNLNELTSGDFETFTGFLRRIIDDEPVQYVVGKAHFYGLSFLVNTSVLIPRPETEELTDYAITLIGNSNWNVVDIGTGSGCIAISLAKKCPNAKISAWDISLDALDLANDNAVIHRTNIHFSQINILQHHSHPVEEKFDLIISNPPYIPEKEKELMSANVLNFEPHLALFVPDDDATLFYKAIFDFCKDHLKPNGHLLLECNEFNIYDVYALGMSMNLFFEGLKWADLSGKERMIHFKRG